LLNTLSADDGYSADDITNFPARSYLFKTMGHIDTNKWASTCDTGMNLCQWAESGTTGVYEFGTGSGNCNFSTGTLTTCTVMGLDAIIADATTKLGAAA